MLQNQRDLCTKSFSRALFPIPSNICGTGEGNLIGDTLKKKKVALPKLSEDSDLFHELRDLFTCVTILNFSQEVCLTYFFIGLSFGNS